MLLRACATKDGRRITLDARDLAGEHRAGLPIDRRGIRRMQPRTIATLQPAASSGWRELILHEGVLAETAPGDSLALWLPDGSNGSYREWERISAAPHA